MEAKDNLIHYTVDGEPQTTTERNMTPRQILTNAGDDPTLVYLIEVKGKDKESFKDKLDVEIHMHEGMVFVTAALGGGPVSTLRGKPWRRPTS